MTDTWKHADGRRIVVDTTLTAGEPDPYNPGCFRARACLAVSYGNERYVRFTYDREQFEFLLWLAGFAKAG